MSYIVLSRADAEVRGCRELLDGVVDGTRGALLPEEFSMYFSGTRFAEYPTEGEARQAIAIGAAPAGFVIHPGGDVTRYRYGYSVDDRCGMDFFESSRPVDTGTGQASVSSMSATSKRVGVAVIVRDRDGRYLMHQRRAGASCDVGMWGVPGGHLECGETVLEAAVREFREETGCELGHASVVAVFDTTNWVTFVVRGRCEGKPVRPDSERDKADEWQWLGSGEVESLRDRGLMQTGLKLWFSGDVGVVSAR
jgi:ADP-ribose pyrophosphatase YjhB (NUDIX family)